MVAVVLFHLIYVSTEAWPMSEDDLAGLLQQARARNERLRLTGMLLYKGGFFMQVLEGEEANVLEVFADIQKDIRHMKLFTMRSEYIQHRDFPDWTMGFTNIDTLDVSTVPAYTPFLEHDFGSEYFSEDTVEAHSLLLAFKNAPETW